MSKQAKTSHAAQDVYETLVAPSKTAAKRKVIITPAREVILLNGAESPVPPDVAIDSEFRGMDDFISRGRNTVLAFHAEFLKVEAPKKSSTEDAAFMTWAWFVKHGRPILDGKTAGGETVRKSTIGSSEYSRGEVSDPAAIKTPQAKVCYSLFTRCIGERAGVTEAELRAFVEANAAELRTKQDPWRIFQYYRPALIASKHMRRK